MQFGTTDSQQDRQTQRANDPLEQITGTRLSGDDRTLSFSARA